MKKRALSEELLYCTTKIECFDANENKSSGTGYFYNVDDIKTKEVVLTLITNKHVVEGAVKIYIYMTYLGEDGEPVDNCVHTLDLVSFNTFIVYHPDSEVDLCMLIITNAIVEIKEKHNIQFYYNALNKEAIPSKDNLNDLRGVENVVMVGYPIGLWDNVNNKPIVRSGITATHPKFNFQDRKEGV